MYLVYFTKKETVSYDTILIDKTKNAEKKDPAKLLDSF